VLGTGRSFKFPPDRKYSRCGQYYFERVTTNKRNGLFITGTILLTIGAGVTTFSPFFIYFYGLPIITFFVGVVLVWLSGRSLKTKVLWTLTPIPIFFIYQFLWRWTNTSEPETFLIPISYRGKVHIIFDEKCGQPPKYENGRRTYQIPDNGVLLTQFKDAYGFIDHKYFFVDSLGERIAIPTMDVRDFNEEWTLEKNPNEPSRDSLGVFHWGRTGGGTFDESEYSFVEFYVSTYKQLGDTFGFKYDSQFDSLEMVLLKDCRKSGEK
jgi:hypothetical protein